jgi:alpha-beta hydrolase superfamily lysophospholipase
VAEALNDAGFSVVAFDHRGHGRSGGKRGHTPSYDQLLSDVDMLLAHARTVAQGGKVFLYGHSMGGNVVLNHALRRKSDVAGVIASSPWLRLAFEPPKFEVTLAGIFRNLLPGFVQGTKLDASAISRDKAVVDAYIKDPLVHDRISVSFFLGTYEAGLWALAHAAEQKKPLYIFHGTADRLTSHDASRQFANLAKGDVKWQSWDGLFHECHNEPEKALVIAAIADWIGQRV